MPRLMNQLFLVGAILGVAGFVVGVMATSRQDDNAAATGPAGLVAPAKMEFGAGPSEGQSGVTVSSALSTGNDEADDEEETDGVFDGHGDDGGVGMLSPFEWGGKQPTAEQVKSVREQRRLRIRTHFEAQLAREPVDVRWQNSLVGKIRGAVPMVPALSQAVVDEVHCGATLCRLSIAAGDPNALAELRRLYSAVGMVLGSEAWAYTDESHYRTEVYVSRPGGSLPPLQAAVAQRE